MTSFSIIIKLSKFIMGILPIISIFVTGQFYPADNQPYRPVFQPPNWVFPVIWSYITLSFGLTNVIALDKVNNPFILVTFYLVILFMLNFWLYLNSENLFKTGFYWLLITAYISVLYLCFLVNQKFNLWYFNIPLSFWLIIASCLNAVIYDRINT